MEYITTMPILIYTLWSCIYVKQMHCKNNDTTRIIKHMKSDKTETNKFGNTKGLQHELLKHNPVRKTQ